MLEFLMGFIKYYLIYIVIVTQMIFFFLLSSQLNPVSKPASISSQIQIMKTNLESETNNNPPNP